MNQDARYMSQFQVAFHQRVTEETGGVPPALLFEKVLEANDVSMAVGSLFVRHSYSLLAALTAEERGKVYNDVRRGFGFLRIDAVDPNGVLYGLHLEQWPIGETVLLARDWLIIVRANGLVEGDIVQGWGYRVVSEDGGFGHGDFRIAFTFIKKSR